MTTPEDGLHGKCDAETCTLRDAVAAANRGEGSTIVLKAETYFLTAGQLELGRKFTIQGAGSRATTIESNRESRVAYVAEGSDVTVNDVTVTGGFAFGQEGDDMLGGGFRVAAGATLVLNRATVHFNDAASGGGGISSAGVLEVVESTVSSNFAGDAAPGNGGGIHVEAGNAVLRNTTVTRNEAFSGIDREPSQGGGVYTAGSLSMEHVTIAQNDATEGGGLYQATDSGPVSMWNTILAENFERACAGILGIVEGSHNLDDDGSCELDQDGDRPDAFAGLLDLDDHGGPTDTHALDVDSEAIDRATADHCPKVDQRGFARPAGDGCDIGATERRLAPVVNTTDDGNDGACAPDPDCTLREALVDSERDEQITLGEGVYKLTLGELQLHGNRTILGLNARRTTIMAVGDHRVLSVMDGTSLVSGVEITGGNLVDGQGADGAIGGGILVLEDAALSVELSAVQGNRAAAGGGIANKGALAILSSTIASNEATGDAGGGGGLLTDYASGSYVENSTVSGNTASAPGGGIANLGGTLYTVNDTIAGNDAPTGAGIYGDARVIDGSFSAGDTTMTNTIVATNAGVQCAWAPEHDIFPDHSLADDDSCFQSAEGNKVEPDPGIGPLSSAFGSTDLHPLLDGSPAIDAGNDFECPFIDQRGAERPQGTRCDIGAFEGGVAATTLRMVTQVPDDSAPASDFTVHVFSEGEEVDSAAGSESGTTFNLEPGTYEVRRSGPDGYIRSFSGDCDAFGKVSIQSDEALTCTLTLDQVTAPPDDACLDYPTFAQAADLNLLGDAAVADDVLRLNPASGGLGGAWFGARRPVADGFTTDFTFRITGAGADGLAFVVQNADVDALGLSGGGIGYQGIANSLAVELDTFSNPENGDPFANHVAVHTRGTEPNDAGLDAELDAAVLNSITDGQPHDVRVVYEPGTLKVFVDGLTTPKLTVDVDLSNLLELDGGAAFVGFTAATGGFVEGHDILSWSLCPPPPATLTVVTDVADEAGWFPEDFTVHVSSDGAEVTGSPKPGDAEGTSYTLAPGSYVISEADARGYAATITGDCAADGSITLGSGDSKVCTITNTPVPLGEGLVVESYGPARTDSEWGLTETFLTETRGYLENPANFGPDGIVARSLQVAPGIRVANARTLAGVDVFFTGWVPTSSYSAAERTALRDFVLGGGTLIATTDDTGHTMVDLFGLTQGDGSGSPTPNMITDVDHPIATGPFGTVTAFDQYFATGHYPQLGADAHEVGRNDAGTTLAVIERHKLGLGSGAAIFVADVDVFSDPGGALDNEALIKNLFAFATRVDPSLRVLTDVVNNDGGTAAASDFSVHLRRNGVEMPGSPASGQGGPGGRLYTLPAGTYSLSADGVPGYTATFSGDCGTAGSVTLEGEQEATCTITLDDVVPTLRVITKVVNDSGGTAEADDFSVHVRRGNEDVPDSPKLGDDGPNGVPYAVEAGGPYVLSASGVAGYTASFSEPCSSAGTITLALDQGAVCTITLDDRAPTLTVVTQVVNDNGGSAAPGSFTVHVRSGGSDVGGSPQPGSASGTTYTLRPGAHLVSADALAGYTTAVSGGCGADGSITLSLGESRSCTVTADDVAPQSSGPPPEQEQQQQEEPPLPPPEPGKTVNAEPTSGTVTIKLKGTNKFVELKEGEQVPVGSVLDTTKGRVTLVAASDKSGGTATADFYAGIFEVGQTKGSKPITTLELVEELSCASGKAAAAATRKKKRRLWGDGSGSFRTEGSYSSATVRGTKWLVEDQCKSTLTKVTRGKVAVRDFVKRKTVIVKAGKQYVARARR